MAGGDAGSTQGASQGGRDDQRDGCRAIFVDRDGVLIEDHGPLVCAEDISLAPGAATALRRLADAGFKIVVVSNQTVVARGLLDPAEMLALHGQVEQRLCAAGASPLDGFYFCPHHPNATVVEYRRSCACRKPAPGMLLEAAAALGINLAASIMIGDRPSDVLAGRRAGCRTIQVTTGRHLDPPIEVEGGFAPAPADHRCHSLGEAAQHILQNAGGGWS
jgi:D-glycero-D-manno-heptose 1,7-bisphosphate phosphatase